MGEERERERKRRDRERERESPLSTCMQGVDSEEPLLQIDNYVFKGKYEDIIGTAMIFQQDKG